MPKFIVISTGADGTIDRVSEAMPTRTAANHVIREVKQHTRHPTDEFSVIPLSDYRPLEWPIRHDFEVERQKKIKVGGGTITNHLDPVRVSVADLWRAMGSDQPEEGGSMEHDRIYEWTGDLPGVGLTRVTWRFRDAGMLVDEDGDEITPDTYPWTNGAYISGFAGQ